MMENWEPNDFVAPEIGATTVNTSKDQETQENIVRVF